MNGATAAPATNLIHSELSRRIVAGLILAGAAIGIGYAGGWLYFAAILIVAALALLELCALLTPNVRRPGLARTVGLLSLACVAASWVTLGAIPAFLVLAGYSVLGGLIAGPRSRDRLIFALGIAVAGLFFVALIWLRGDEPPGRASLFWLFAVVWATDVGAYAVGRALGGAKLAPGISPNKTWSGAVGGLLLGVGGGVLLGWLAAVFGWVPSMPHLGLLIGLGALISAVSQAGDLVESMLKRAAGKKDSGTLIPGHGGVLDRLDGFIPAAIILVLISLVAGEGHLPWMVSG